MLLCWRNVQLVCSTILLHSAFPPFRFFMRLNITFPSEPPERTSATEAVPCIWCVDVSVVRGGGGGGMSFSFRIRSFQ